MYQQQLTFYSGFQLDWGPRTATFVVLAELPNGQGGEAGKAAPGFRLIILYVLRLSRGTVSKI